MFSPVLDADRRRDPVPRRDARARLRRRRRGATGSTAALGKRVTPRTKLLYWNSPTNPTGEVFSRARDRGGGGVRRATAASRVISDEAYEDLIYEGEGHVSPASLPGHVRADDHRLHAVEDVLDDGLARRLRPRPEALARRDADGRSLLDQRRLDADAVGDARGAHDAAPGSSRRRRRDTAGAATRSSRDCARRDSSSKRRARRSTSSRRSRPRSARTPRAAATALLDTRPRRDRSRASSSARRARAICGSPSPSREETIAGGAEALKEPMGSVVGSRVVGVGGRRSAAGLRMRGVERDDPSVRVQNHDRRVSAFTSESAGRDPELQRVEGREAGPRQDAPAAGRRERRRSTMFASSSHRRDCVAITSRPSRGRSRGCATAERFRREVQVPPARGPPASKMPHGSSAQKRRDRRQRCGRPAGSPLRAARPPGGARRVPRRSARRRGKCVNGFASMRIATSLAALGRKSAPGDAGHSTRCDELSRRRARARGGPAPKRPGDRGVTADTAGDARPAQNRATGARASPADPSQQRPRPSRRQSPRAPARSEGRRARPSGESTSSWTTIERVPDPRRRRVGSIEVEGDELERASSGSGSFPQPYGAAPVARKTRRPSGKAPPQGPRPSGTSRPDAQMFQKPRSRRRRAGELRRRTQSPLGRNAAALDPGARSRRPPRTGHTPRPPRRTRRGSRARAGAARSVFERGSAPVRLGPDVLERREARAQAWRPLAGRRRRRGRPRPSPAFGERLTERGDHGGVAGVVERRRRRPRG